MCIKCVACGESLAPNESPCPKCGELGRVFSLEATSLEVCTEIESVDINVTFHWDHLLESAETLHAAGHFSSAIVVAQTACEVVTARAIGKAFDSKRVPELREPVMRLLSSASLRGDKARLLYDALTNDNINQHRFWPRYIEMVRLRNAVAHNGETATQEQSRKLIDAASEFVAHVGSHNQM